MFISRATIAACLSSLALAQASPAPLARKNDAVSCQTSDGSPLVDDVTRAIYKLRANAGTCKAENSVGSQCVRMVKSDTASIVICGSVSDSENDQTCSKVADYADAINSQCISGTKVGGTYQIDAGLKIEIVHN